MHTALPLAITCGDPAGVGPEIIAQWLKAHPEEIERVRIFAWADFLRQTGAKGAPVGEADFTPQAGRPTSRGAQVAWLALEAAAQSCLKGECAAVVTAPVSKIEMVKAGHPFVGQTEFFAERWGGKPVMAFAGGRLAVCLATWHIPFREVPAQLTAETLQRAVQAADRLGKSLGRPTPRIAVCGLNPHAGEGGVLGREEKEIINPILRRLRKDYPLLSEALPPDTVFWRQLRGEFDVAVALYHDQGLCAVKAVDFEEAVNISMGLKYVRTSPDHGTAFGIAGKGVASIRSFENAVRLARQLSA